MRDTRAQRSRSRTPAGAGTRALALPALALVMATALSGCVFGQQDALPTVQVDTPEVPASLAQPEELVFGGGQILAASEDLPYAYGGSLQKPGAAAAPTVWTSEDGLSWDAVAVDDDFDGGFSGSLHGSGSLSALAGTAWVDGEIGTVLWTSKDRESWKRVALPGEFADHYRLSDFAVHGGSVLLIGSDTDGELGGLLVNGSDTTSVTLPKPPKDEELNPIGVVWGDDDHALLLTESAAEGDNGPIVAYTSDDGGETWSTKATEVVGSADFASGVVWTGSAYVVTGGVYAASAEGAPYRPAAWSSPDGTAWAAESVPAASSEQTGFETTDAWLGEPSVGAAGEVGAIQPNDNSALSALYLRTADGVWQYVGDTGVNEGNGVNGLALPLAEGGLLGAIGTEGGVRFGTTAGGWTDGTTLSSVARSAAVTSIQQTPDGALLTLDRSVFSVSPDLHWNNSSVASQAIVSTKGTVADAEWDPPEAAALINVVGATSGDEQVLLGSDYSSGEEIIARGWYRAGPDEPWQALTGFPGGGATGFVAIERIGDLWVATGDYRTDSHVGTPSHGVVWTSADGVTWTPAPGDFGSGSMESNAIDVCTTGDDTPIAVGWTETTPGTYAIAAWSPGDDGTWTAVDLGEFGEGSGYAYGCTEGEDGLIVSALFGGRTALLLQGDGAGAADGGWKRVFEADTDDVLTNPVAVPGGYAASGSWSDATHSQPVVWLSADGRTWTPVAVPSFASGLTTQVAALGDDLIVTMSPESGSPVSIVRDIEAVIGQHAKK